MEQIKLSFKGVQAGKDIEIEKKINNDHKQKQVKKL